MTVFLTVVCVGMLLMWAYIFQQSWSGQYPYADAVPDQAWVASAETLCAAARADLADLPQAREFRDATPADRAPSVAAATDRLAALVVDLRGLPAPADDRSRTLVEQWLASWDIYLGDRRLHTEKLFANDDARFSETPTERGVPTTLRMDEFAFRNGMGSCETPADLA